MRTPALIPVGIVFPALLSACQSGASCSDMPFGRAAAVTRIEIRANDGTLPARQISDPARIERILNFAKARKAGWYSPWYGVPAGPVHVEFWRETRFVADFSAGKSFFEAQGCGYFLIRAASSREVGEYLDLLGTKYEFK